MGYTTAFEGRVQIEPPLEPVQIMYINKFNATRRMKRDARQAEAMPDPIRSRVNFPIGKEGAYFVGATGPSGQDRDGSIVNYNEPPEAQPGLWCQWEVTDDGAFLQWDGAEKFYNYTAWLVYLIEHFFKPWNRRLNGEIQWRGETPEDVRVIVVRDNVVVTRPGLDTGGVQESWIVAAVSDLPK
jgi:hypothetical protein